MQETLVQFLGQEDPLEKRMATGPLEKRMANHFSFIALRTP